MRFVLCFLCFRRCYQTLTGSGETLLCVICCCCQLFSDSTDDTTTSTQMSRSSRNVQMLRDAWQSFHIVVDVVNLNLKIWICDRILDSGPRENCDRGNKNICKHQLWRNHSLKPDLWFLTWQGCDVTVCVSGCDSDETFSVFLQTQPT